MNWFQIISIEIKNHERLFLTIVVAVVIFFTANHYLDAWHEADMKAQTIAEEKVKQDQSSTAELQKKYNDLQKTASDSSTALQDLQLTVQKNIQDAKNQLISRQAQDSKLTNQQLADKLDSLTAQKDIQATQQGLELNHQQAIQTTQELEKIQNLDDIIDSDSKVMSRQSKNIIDVTNEAGSCKDTLTATTKELADTKAADQKEIKVLKTIQLKTKAKWALGGFIVGFITGILK